VPARVLRSLGCGSRARSGGRLSKALLALAVTLWMPGAVAAQEPPEAQGPWPMVGRDAHHGGAAAGPAPPYRVAWAVPVEPGGPLAGPVLADGALFVPAAGAIVALAPEDGRVLWSWPRTEGPSGPAAVGDGLVFHASGSGSATSIVARRVEDGREVWRAPIGSAVTGGPAVAEGAVFVGTGAGLLVALEAETGEERWRFEGDGAVATSPAVAGGLVLAASQNVTSGRATVYGIDEQRGAVEGSEWQLTPPRVPSAFPTSVSASQNLAFVGTSDGMIRGLDLETGLERWSTPSRELFVARQVPAASPEGLLIPDRVHLYLLDPSTGEERWVYRLADLEALPGGRVNTLAASSPAVVGDFAVIGDAEGVASAIDVSTGRLVWRDSVGPGPIGAVAVAGDRIYLSSQGREGRVVALEHDPEGRLLDEVSPTVLFPLRALATFVVAVVIVGGLILGVFRYALRPRRRGAGEAP
jgi:outer membrane protein assembly factor BamB